PAPPCYSITPTSATALYTLSLHDALPIFVDAPDERAEAKQPEALQPDRAGANERAHDSPQRAGSEPALPSHALHMQRGRHRGDRDRKSTRLNSSHSQISYAVFCLKKTMRH